MAKSTRDIVKRRSSETGTFVGVRLQQVAIETIDGWRRDQSDLPSRPEAIRRLIDLGLKAGASGGIDAPELVRP